MAIWNECECRQLNRNMAPRRHRPSTNDHIASPKLVDHQHHAPLLCYLVVKIPKWFCSEMKKRHLVKSEMWCGWRCGIVWQRLGMRMMWLLAAGRPVASHASDAWDRECAEINLNKIIHLCTDHWSVALQCVLIMRKLRGRVRSNATTDGNEEGADFIVRARLSSRRTPSYVFFLYLNERGFTYIY